ncbi:MAG: tetratricopeptide repeat protein [Pyrinomonadaceae bacterium]
MRSQLSLTAFLFAIISASGCGSGKAESGPIVAEPAKADVVRPTLSTPHNQTLLFLEGRIRSDPDDFIARNKVAAEYMREMHETGDIAYLDLALRSAKASLAILPPEQNKGGLAALAQAQFASHDFAGSLASAERLSQIDPDKGYVYQMIGDSHLELGNYEDAESAFKTMDELGGIQTTTQLAMEQRYSRLAMLKGDTSGSKKHLEKALSLARKPPGVSAETLAYCTWLLGESAFAEGDHRSAEKYYRESLTAIPDHYRSLASLGRVRAAQNDLAGAIENYEKVVKILPDPAFAASLGDLYKLAGRQSDAERQYALVEQIGRLSELSGSLYNRQLALFYADHDLKADEAYIAAVREYEMRHDIYGADAVAWTALKAGKIPEAESAMTDAMQLGTRDARLYYHAGMIEKAAGHGSQALRLLTQALKINQGFDPLQATVAKETIETLKQQ